MSDLNDIKELMEECYQIGITVSLNENYNFKEHCHYELLVLEDMPLFQTQKPVQSDEA